MAVFQELQNLLNTGGLKVFHRSPRGRGLAHLQNDAGVHRRINA